VHQQSCRFSAMARCNLALGLFLAFALQVSARRTRMLKVGAVLNNTSPYAWSRGALADGRVDFWLLGEDQWNSGEGWHWAFRHWESGQWAPLASELDRNTAWQWVNNVGSSSNVYWALHCFRGHDGTEEMFGWLDNGSYRSSPYLLDERTYNQFWDEAQPNIKKWYDDAYSEAQAKIHNQMVLDMAQANIHDHMELSPGG